MTLALFGTKNFTVQFQAIEKSAPHTPNMTFARPQFDTRPVSIIPMSKIEIVIDARAKYRTKSFLITI